MGGSTVKIKVDTTSLDKAMGKIEAAKALADELAASFASANAELERFIELTEQIEDGAEDKEE